jgi:Protein of unknown function (DUF 659)
MPKSKPLFSSTLRKYVNEFGGDIFSTDGTILYCKVCEVRVSAEKKFTIQQHVASNKHIVGVQKKNDKKTSCLQTLITTSSNSCFNSDLCKAFLSANIPLNKLSQPTFRKFLEKYTNKSIPDQSTLRKTYVHECYEDTLCEIRTYASNKKIWISIDETTDTMGRYIANTVIGTLELCHPGKDFLLDSTVLEKANSGTIVRCFEQSLSLLWPGGIQRENVLLFLSDAAPYMVKAGKALKLLYSKMEHVTCLAHALHRVAEEIRNIFPKVNDLISNAKKIFLKAPYRLQIFKTIAPNIPLPPQPILTRWGTWLNAAMYYSEHYVLIKQVVMELNREDAISIGKVQDLMADRNLECNLAYIKSNFGTLPETIIRLELSGRTLADSIQIVTEFQNKIQEIKNERGKIVQLKLKNVLEKNTGFNTICNISKILEGTELSITSLPDDLSFDDMAFMRYAPITSVDVERSFSAFKNLLTDNRQSFLFENIKRALVVQCNSKY